MSNSNNNNTNQFVCWKSTNKKKKKKNERQFYVDNWCPTENRIFKQLPHSTQLHERTRQTLPCLSFNAPLYASMLILFQYTTLLFLLVRIFVVFFFHLFLFSFSTTESVDYVLRYRRSFTHSQSYFLPIWLHFYLVLLLFICMHK